MARVKLGEVAREYKATVKDTSGLPIVGLEHLTPGEISLEHWDEGTDNTFTKGFKKGQMLFGRRRAYLKKAALAPFDGVCSGDITVIEAIPERMNPELLPFIIQNDLLFDYAVGNSAGSLSPRVKWESLKNYEFDLPEMSKQSDLVELLKAAHETKRSYRALLEATDELVKSQFIEMFQNKGYPMKKGKELFKFSSGKFLPEEKRLDTGIPVYGGNGIAWYTDESLVDYDTIVIGRVGVYCGNVRLVRGSKWITDNAIYISEFKTNDFKLEFLEALMTILDFHQYAGTAAQPKITQKPLEEQMYIVPPIDEQVGFSKFVDQSDKSKFELQQAIQRVDNLIKSLISQE